MLDTETQVEQQAKLNLPEEMYAQKEQPPRPRKEKHTDISDLMPKDEEPPTLSSDAWKYHASLMKDVENLQPVLNESTQPRLTKEEIIAYRKQERAEAIAKANAPLSPEIQNYLDALEQEQAKQKKLTFAEFSPKSAEWWNTMDQLIYRRLGSVIHEHFFEHLYETVNNSDRPLGELHPIIAKLDSKEFDSINDYAKAELIDIFSKQAHQLQEAILKRRNDISAQTGETMHAFVLPNFFLRNHNNEPKYVDGLAIYCPEKFKPMLRAFIREYRTSRKEGYHKACDVLLRKLAPDIQEIEMEAIELKTFVKENEEITELHSNEHLKQIRGYVKILVDKIGGDDQELRALLEENIRGVLTNVFIPAVDENHQVNSIGQPIMYVNDVASKH